MSQQDNSYNPNSLDAVLTRIETKLDGHIEGTERYRRERSARDAAVEKRVSVLEGDKKKLLGIAIGGGIGSGTIAGTLLKWFGSGTGQ